MSFDWGKFAERVVNPLRTSTEGILNGIKDDDWSSVIQYVVDPVTEPGIDYAARGSGEAINRKYPGLLDNVSPYVTALAAILTSHQGGWGALPAYELMNKMRGGSAKQGVIGGAAIGATMGAGAYANGLASGAGGANGAVTGSTMLGSGGGGATTSGMMSGGAGTSGAIGTGTISAAGNGGVTAAGLMNASPSVTEALMKKMGKRIVTNELKKVLTNQTPTGTDYQYYKHPTGYGLMKAQPTPPVQPVQQPMTLQSNMNLATNRLNNGMQKSQKEEINPEGYVFKPEDYLAQYLINQKEQENRYAFKPQNFLGKYLA